MADEPTKAVDAATGTPFKGHEWDGIRELDTPLPRWWLWTFYATILFAIGYTIAYPAWPMIDSATRGMRNWHLCIRRSPPPPSRSWPAGRN